MGGAVFTPCFYLGPGEGNGTQLQYFCLEGPMDGGAWKAAVHGVARVGHDWATSLSLFTVMHWRRKWQPTPAFLPGESQGRGSLVGCRHGVAQSWTRLKRHSSSSSSSSRLVNWPNCNFVVSQWIWGPKEKGRDSKCPDFGAVRTHTTFINQVHYLILVGFLVLQLQQ